MLRKIRYFQMVVKKNSFSEAAEECNISQSAISQQIKALEEELGFLLLIRKNRKFELTPAGEYFYRKSLLLVSEYEQICKDSMKIAKQDEMELRIGFLRGYTGMELHRAIEKFSMQYPDVNIQIQYGNHEHLYQMIRTEEVDLVLNDQRRAFSDEYMNLVLATIESHIEVSSRSILADLQRITPQELKNVPCILVSAKEEEEQEEAYYHDVIGFEGEFLFARTLEEARLMVISKKGFMPVEGRGTDANFGTSITKIPLYRGNEPMTRNYCAFWKKDNSGYYVEEFAQKLKQEFITPDLPQAR